MQLLGFRHLELPPSCQGDALRYAHSLGATEGVLYSAGSLFSNDGCLGSALINEKFPDMATFYYGKVEGCESIDYEDLLLHKSHLLGKRLKRLGGSPLY